MIRYLHNHDVKSVERLLKQGFDPNSTINVSLPFKHRKTRSKSIPLHYLLHLNRDIGQDDVDIVKLLIEYGTNINHDNYIDGENLIMKLLQKNSDDEYIAQITKLFLNVTTINNKRDIMVYSLRLKRTNMIKLLLKYENEINVDDLIKNNEELSLILYDFSILSLIPKYLKIDTLKKKYKDPLFTCCKIGCYNAVKRILNDDSSDVNTLRKHNYLQKVLLLRLVETKTNKFYCEEGMDNREYNKYIKTAKILIDYGANIDESIKNNDIKTYATERKDTIICTLLEHIPKVLISVIIEFV
jgi:hypothetical protein